MVVAMIETVKKAKIFKVLLSYDVADKQSAEKLRAILSRRKDVRLVVREGHEASPSPAELRSSDLYVVVLSPKSRESAWLLQELGAAWGACKGIVPVKTQRDVNLPISLDGLVCFELDQVLQPENWNRILASFEGALEGRCFNFLTKNPLD